MPLFGFGKQKTAPLESQLQEIEDMAELAQSPQDIAELAKSVSKLAVQVAKNGGAAAVAAGASGGKVVDSDDDDDDDDYRDDDDLDDDDADDDDDDADGNGGYGNGGAASVGALAQGTAQGGRRMTKSITQALAEQGVETGALEAGEILDAVSQGLLENNRVAFANQELLQKSLVAVQALGKRVARLEKGIESRDEMLKGVASFVETTRRSPHPTPRAGRDETPASALADDAVYMNKSLGDFDGGSFGQSETLRGLSAIQLIKGLTIHLDQTNGEESGLSLKDLHAIGTVPMSELNPKIAEVAAPLLGVTLK